MADAEGGAFASSGRVVADRNGNHACGGGTTRWRGLLRAGVRAPIQKRIWRDHWLGFSEFAFKQTVADRQGRQGGGLWNERPWRGLIGQVYDPKVCVILVEERERLMRFGFECREGALGALSRSIMVVVVVLVDPSEMADHIAPERDDQIVSLCARRYGKRSARNCAKKALAGVA
ncbi:hypothetical protein [Candidatus Methylacidithermus pantelleriae]|uniref:hypothetical protein n=1 Tax=Candidatus Methylacidithermus pantelleriae TaxID=2744239 RepID=UPI001BD45EEA|nr:hypothetical protein [Candidatus Methylacidithermus pantelleriae]